MTSVPVATSDASQPIPPQDQQPRFPRFPYFGSIFLSWIGAGGKTHVMGRCFDISEKGVGVEIANLISVGTEVSVRAEWANLNTAATVRHIARRGGALQLGLELKQPIPPEFLAKLSLAGSN